jgi:hypothetical protein
MSAKKRPITTPPKRAEMDTSHVFNHTVRLRQKGNRRPGTKTKKQRAAMERAFQAELTRLRSTAPPELPKEKLIPEAQLLKPKKPKRKTLLQQMREKITRKPE